MLYQVLFRKHADTAWLPYQAPARDLFTAMRLIQAAGSQHAEVSVVQAATVRELVQLLRRIRSGEIPAPAVSAVPGLTSTPRVRIVTASLEERYWEIELGPAGDNDTPYAFELPASMQVLSHWLRLLRRFQEAEQLAAREVAAETSSGAA